MIGLPGDTISYQDRRLTINGKLVPETYLGDIIEPNDSISQPVKEYQEDLFGVVHAIYLMPWTPTSNFKGLVVPAGELFVMGDNRDDSDDSRYWGFVPVQNVIGEATHVWLSWDETTNNVRWDRFGQSI